MNKIYLKALRFSLLLLCSLTTTSIFAYEMELTDTISPTPIINIESVTVNDPFSLTVSFSEDITNLEAEAVYIDNGVISNINQIDQLDYSISITPITGGIVRFALPPGAVDDLTGNASLASDTIIITYHDDDNPRPSLVRNLDSESDFYEVDLIFNEPIYGLEAEDFQLTVDNGNIESIEGEEGSSEYTLFISTNNPAYPTAISLAPEKVEDASGNLNEASNLLVLTAIPDDNEPPTVSLTTASEEVSGSFMVEIQFSEEITGLDLDDIEITNGTVADLSFSQVSGSFEVMPTAAGLVSIRIPEEKVADLNDNLNEASNLLEVTYIEPDTNRPEIFLEVLADDNPKERTIKLSFSEPVSDLILDNIELINCEVTTFQRLEDEQAYLLVLEAIEEGTAIFNILENGVTDNAGNGSYEMGAFSWEYSTIPLGSVDTIFTLLPLKVEDTGVGLTWETNTENIDGYFVVMHTDDLMTEFESIDTVASQAGSGEEILSYDYIHKKPSFGNNYYRIRQVYADSSFYDSNIQSIKHDVFIEEGLVYPNPVVGNTLKLNITRYAGIRAEILIFNKAGKVYFYKVYEELPVEPIEIDVSGYESGFYGVQFWIKASSKIEQKFIIAH